MSIAEPPPRRDPFGYLRKYWPNVPIRTKRLDDDRWGLTEWLDGDEPQITLSDELDGPARVETACHEMLHVERGAPDEHDEVREEAAVVRQTARWLLPNVKLVHAAIETHGLRRAAAILGLPARVLVTRMRSLSRWEAYRVYEREE
jgi:hypothetical protein